MNGRKMKYKLKFMFDWGSGTCIWAANNAARAKYGYAVDIDELPISEELCECMVRLCEEHDLALDWECPQNGPVWTGQEQKAFKERAKQIYQRICEELAEEFEIVLGTLI